MTKIVFATKNEGKIKEIQSIMGDKYNIISMKEAGINIDIIEDGTTFEENAVKKASETMKICNCIVLADDSGLEIDFLNKEPGIYSSRYMGENTPYSIKNKKIIEIMKDVPYEKRTARFVSVIAAAFPDGKIITTTGVLEGIISYEISGENGFGYDPIFFVPEYNKTTAQMSMQEKNNISHRGKALKSMKIKLEEVINN